MVMKWDTSGHEFMTRCTNSLRRACNTDRMVMKWDIFGHDFMTVGMNFTTSGVHYSENGHGNG